MNIVIDVQKTYNEWLIDVINVQFHRLEHLMIYTLRRSIYIFIVKMPFLA